MRTLVVICFLALLGCSSSSSSGSSGGAVTQAAIDQSCTDNCAAQKKCTSSIDESTCGNKCRNDAASYVDKVRADFLSFFNDCVQTASCDKLKDCDDTAKASISPTSAVQSFCDELVKKHTACKFANNSKSNCLENFKIFSDGAVQSAGTCLTKACGDYGACVLSTVGVKF